MDERAPAPDVWIDARLTVAASPIEGRGLHFSTDVPGDTVVIRLGGRLVSSAQLTDLLAAADQDPAAPYVITSDDWRRPDLQARYRGHWVPALDARIREGE